MKEINDDMSNNDLTQIRFHLKLRAGLDERRMKRFCTIMKNSIEDGSIRSFMIECRDAIKEDRRKFKFYCNFTHGRHPHLT